MSDPELKRINLKLNLLLLINAILLILLFFGEKSTFIINVAIILLIIYGVGYLAVIFKAKNNSNQS